MTQRQELLNQILQQCGNLHLRQSSPEAIYQSLLSAVHNDGLWHERASGERGLLIESIFARIQISLQDFSELAKAAQWNQSKIQRSLTYHRTIESLLELVGLLEVLILKDDLREVNEKDKASGKELLKVLTETARIQEKILFFSPNVTGTLDKLKNISIQWHNDYDQAQEVLILFKELEKEMSS